MIISFCLAWTPYAVFAMLSIAHINLSSKSELVVFFGKTSTVFNPLIILFRSKKLRRNIVKMFMRRTQLTVESSIFE